MSDRTSPEIWWQSRRTTRVVFWIAGVLFAFFQSWTYRYGVTADSISYLDMSDGVFSGVSWGHLINGTWSPLYPLLLGLFRLVFSISPANEIIAAHLFNVVLFLFALVCFEFFLKRLQAVVVPALSGEAAGSAISPWAFHLLAYSLFFWSAFDAISLRFLRPDMLMSGFLYLPAGILLGMRAAPPRWPDYLKLGIVLGIGILAKELMLPIGGVVLLITLFFVQDWRPALKFAIASFAIMFAIGCLYFVPLSLKRGKITLGESGGYNYLVHVDRAGPGDGWYLENPGQGSGRFLHPPLQIFQSPPAYAFPRRSRVTHPLRFDPAEWMQGVHPRFAFKRQVGEFYANVVDLSRSLRRLVVFLLVIVIPLLFARPRRLIWQSSVDAWPILCIGVAGCAAYLLVHVEARYVGAFLVLIGCAALQGVVEVIGVLRRELAFLVIGLIVLSLLTPVVLRTASGYRRYGRGRNDDASAAAALVDLQLRPGDFVSRISPLVTDLGPERIGRFEVVSEIDFARANQFWSEPLEVQRQILDRLVESGSRAVIATRPFGTPPARQRWIHLAGDYWAWLPAGAGSPAGLGDNP